MRLPGLLALSGLVIWASPGKAQVFVGAPFVRVWSDPAPGGGVYIRAPGVRVSVPDGPPVIVAPPPPVYVAPPPAVVVMPPPAPVVVTPPPVVVVTRPQTPQEFAQTFRPTPGPHEAVLIHPRTGQAVRVAFSLPPGTPRVFANQRVLEFDYGRTRVTIIFGIAGGVRVYPAD